MFSKVVSTLFEIQQQKDISSAEERGDAYVSTLFEIQRLMRLVVVGF
jgi:hypothetical protein